MFGSGLGRVRDSIRVRTGWLDPIRKSLPAPPPNKTKAQIVPASDQTPAGRVPGRQVLLVLPQHEGPCGSLGLWLGRRLGRQYPQAHARSTTRSHFAQVLTEWRIPRRMVQECPGAPTCLLIKCCTCAHILESTMGTHTRVSIMCTCAHTCT